MSPLKVDLENVSSSDGKDLPSVDNFRRWAELCLQPHRFNTLLPEINIQQPSLSLRIVDEEEMQALNQQFRNKNQPTNVLSFSCELPPGVELELLGDIVICAPVVVREAQEQSKDQMAHWAHMVIHGCLHLLGYDHIDDADAEVMEALETAILKELAYPAPYETS